MDKLTRAADFLRLLLGRIEAGEFVDVSITRTGDVDFDKSFRAGLLEYTDRKPSAIKIVTVPRRMP